MNDLLKNVPEITLMGPGPSCVPPEVYEALSVSTLGHLDPYFIRIMDEIKTRLRKVFGTINDLTIPMSGTGSAGMETCFVNLVEPGDSVLVCVNGVFGTRMVDVAGRLGAEVESLDFEWGTPVIPERVAEALKGKKYDLVAVVHAETSTGVRNPVDEIGTIVKEYEALYLVDTVTSLGGMEVAVDAWGADAVYSGTQKCLSCPPGLAPVTFSPDALKKLKARKSKVPNWYLDLSMIMGYWEGNKRSYHHTAPINMLYGLYRALGLVLDEGLEAVFDRHLENHRLLVRNLEELGLPLYVNPEYRLPMLNAVTCPRGIDESAVRARLLSEFNIEIGAGLGPLAGTIWRVGLMGHTARPENVEKLTEALRKCL